MIDLHTHTTFSDGAYTPWETLELAEKRNLSIISFTDHNSVDAYLDTYRDVFSGKILTGTELSTSYNGELIEVLAYNIDVASIKDFISNNYYTVAQKREKEFDIITEHCAKSGIKIDPVTLRKSPQVSTKLSYFNEVTRYPENSKFFLYDESKKNRTNFIRKEAHNPKSPFFVDLTALFPSLQTVIDIIHDCGGFAFLAHLYSYTPDTIRQLEDIVTYGLDGLECKYTSFTEENSLNLIRYCDEHFLYKSGGSDFHGEERRRPTNLLGKPEIDDIFCAEWLSKCNFI